MRHPFEKLIRVEILSIIGAGMIGIFMVFQGFILLMIISLYLLALSMIAEAIIKWHMNDKKQSAKQFSRSIILFILTTYLIFKL